MRLSGCNDSLRVKCSNKGRPWVLHTHHRIMTAKAKLQWSCHKLWYETGRMKANHYSYVQNRKNTYMYRSVTLWRSFFIIIIIIMKYY